MKIEFVKLEIKCIQYDFNLTKENKIFENSSEQTIKELEHHLSIKKGAQYAIQLLKQNRAKKRSFISRLSKFISI